MTRKKIYDLSVKWGIIYWVGGDPHEDSWFYGFTYDIFENEWDKDRFATRSALYQDRDLIQIGRPFSYHSWKEYNGPTCSQLIIWGGENYPAGWMRDDD